MCGHCEDMRRQWEMIIRRYKRLPATYKPYRLVMMSWLIKGKEMLTFRNDSRFVALLCYSTMNH